jgi:hypothetical protein
MASLARSTLLISKRADVPSPDIETRCSRSGLCCGVLACKGFIGQACLYQAREKYHQSDIESLYAALPHRTTHDLEVGSEGRSLLSVLGSALHVMLFPVCLIDMLCIFNGLCSGICLRALLGYHYPYRRTQLLSLPTCSQARYWTQSKTYRPDSRPRRVGAAVPQHDAPGARAADRR